MAEIIPLHLPWRKSTEGWPPGSGRCNVLGVGGVVIVYDCCEEVADFIVAAANSFARTTDDQVQKARIQKAVRLVVDDLVYATRQNSTFNSAHEGYAVILEELDELKAEILKKRSERNPEELVKEATQVAAMAVRFMVDVCGAQL